MEIRDGFISGDRDRGGAGANGRIPTPPRFNLQSLLEGPAADPLGLLAEHVNPSFAAMLRTIGFDARFVRGQGAYLWDDRGNRYIDLLGGYAVFNLGRNHPAVADALRQALDLDLPNLPGVGTFRLAGLLAKELIAVAPGDLGNVFFASGGGEAVDVALKHARAATGRQRIIHCHRSYHGLTMGALSVTANHEFQDGFGALVPGSTEIPFNDLDALERELLAGDVAAFIVEPIQGKGVNVPSPDYLREASRLCRRFGSLLILDEVQTGLGRTGRMWACQHFGAGENGGQGDWQPDMMVVSKALSGGYVPVSAVLMRDWVHREVFGSMSQCSRIQTTFGMNDLAMVAGLATLHALRHEGIVEHAARVGDRLKTGFAAMTGRYELFKEVRGCGLMLAVEFHRPRAFTLRTGWDLLHRLDPSLFCQAILMPLMSEHRILAQVAGHRLDVIKLIPPLVLSDADADEVLTAFDATIGACHRFPGPAWEVGKKLGAAALRRFAPGRKSSAAAAASAGTGA